MQNYRIKLYLVFYYVIVFNANLKSDKQTNISKFSS